MNNADLADQGIQAKSVTVEEPQKVEDSPVESPNNEIEQTAMQKAASTGLSTSAQKRVNFEAITKDPVMGKTFNNSDKNPLTGIGSQIGQSTSPANQSETGDQKSTTTTKGRRKGKQYIEREGNAPDNPVGRTISHPD